MKDPVDDECANCGHLRVHHMWKWLARLLGFGKKSCTRLGCRCQKFEAKP